MTSKEGNGYATPAKSTAHTLTPTGPFPFSPSDLQHLFDPKSTAQLTALGGIEGLCSGLQVDLKVGLSASDAAALSSVTVGDHNPTVSDSPLVTSSGSSSGIERTFRDRISVFGRNVLPEAESQTLFQLMV
ncbi:plasma membrane calcium [Gonapodya sp. JEL0774]|nr:plasma membrane calcium [Gonapodya sp. JEL0774]